MDVPSSRSFNSLRESFLSLRNCFSISWLILFCSKASSLKQQAIDNDDEDEDDDEDLCKYVYLCKWDLCKWEDHPEKRTVSPYK